MRTNSIYDQIRDTDPETLEEQISKNVEIQKRIISTV